MIQARLPLFLLITLSAFAQSGSDGQQVYADLVNANTRFAFKFFRASVDKTPDQNVLLSPTALSLDFALLQNAANPPAREQIVSVFEFSNLSSSAINQQSSALKRALIYDPPKRAPKTAPKHGIRPPEICCAPPPEHLTLSGSLWTQPSVAFRSDFLRTNKEFYGYTAKSVRDRGVEGLKAVNDWISGQTSGTLSNALSSWQRDDFLVVDATSFKGAWVHPFNESATHPGFFKLPRGLKKELPMMGQSGSFQYLHTSGFQAVCLPYFHASMYLFLPDDDSGLKDLQQSLTSEKFAAWLGELSEQEGYLELPKFEADFRDDITESLRAMGMDRAFDSFSSFGPLVDNPEGAKLTRVLQVISLKVDEKGMEGVSAGIVGGVIGGVSGDPRPLPFRMIVDHPFLFVIADDQSHAILYMGAINDPSPMRVSH